MFTAASHREHEAYNDNTSQQTSDGPIHLTMSTDPHTHYIYNHPPVTFHQLPVQASVRQLFVGIQQPGGSKYW